MIDKPNNDLPTNRGGRDFTQSGVTSTEDDEVGTTMGEDNEFGANLNSFGFGKGLQSFDPNQFIVGTYNNPTEDAIFQVGGGTHPSGRLNALSIERGDDGYAGYVNNGRILTDQFHYTTSGVKRSSRKTFTASGTTAGDGTITVYPTHDNTASGIAIFNEITFATAVIVDSSPSGSRTVFITSLTVSGVSFEVHSSGTYDLLIKIEGN